MKTEVRFRAMDGSDALRAHVRRAIFFHLSRFNGAVQSVVVRLADVNGPRGGVDKRCQVTLRGPSFGSVTLEDLDADAYAVVDTTLERAGRALRRALDRGRTVRRSSVRLMAAPRARRIAAEADDATRSVG